MLSCGWWAAGNVTRASGNVFLHMWRAVDGERREGGGDVIARAASSATRAGGGNVVAREADKATSMVATAGRQVTQCDGGVALMAAAEGTTAADERGVVTADGTVGTLADGYVRTSTLP